MFWVEVHCDTTLDEREKAGLDGLCRSACLTNKGDMPGVMGRKPGEAAREVRGIARRQGWRTVGGRFCCPSCATMLEQARKKV